jgi:ribonuclease E
MPNKMLIDASHPEETRVVVLRGNRVEEFDFESADKRQLRGNIYLAKVTRVEPSLQAAFVDYGGNRHGFLAFSEIHPDYYQIPVSDRQELLQEDAAAHREDEEEDRKRSRRRRPHGERAEKRRGNKDEKLTDSRPAELESAAEPGEPETETPAEQEIDRAPEYLLDEKAVAPLDDAAEDAEAPPIEPRDIAPAAISEGSTDSQAGPHRLATDPEGFAIVEDEQPRAVPAETETRIREKSEEDEESSEDEQIEQLGGDAMEEMPVRSYRSRRQYKIQEVIKRRQVLLVQVVKEERGNKGAALTTYLSLAGRYSVLMPNTARGGGISRKITDTTDRQRLKIIAQDLEVPEGMGVILRTAGASRTKAEVKRDFEYLLRMWETVREMTLKSTAPTLVYEEGSLIKRAIRDLYNKDIDEVTVSGEAAYREAKEFMRMLMPSHAKNVHLYRDPQPIFAKSGVEAQLDAMFTNQVTLKSGGYLVINQTEALVAIDVNSGRSTREHDIEDTALRTNLEAADEIARQLRLRDLAGLIVVDFIDMEEGRNNRAVERRMKEALKNDRARIQIGRISHFGLLEMSRQRIRTGVLEGSTVICAHCGGSGTVRSTSSVALHVLRLLEDALIKSAAHNITLRTRSEVALYILNQKRANLRDLEQRFGVSITIVADDSLTGTAYHAMERGEPATGLVQPHLDALHPVDEARPDTEEYSEEVAQPEQAPESEDENARRKRRRRRRRGRDSERPTAAASPATQPSDDALALVAGIGTFGDRPPQDDERGGEMLKRDGGRRRRSRRRGRGGRTEADTSRGAAAEASEEARNSAERRLAPTPVAGAPAELHHEKPASSAAEPRAEESRLSESEPEEAPDPNRPKRTGWWQRAKAGLGG